jgi:hypothetical protein
MADLLLAPAMAPFTFALALLLGLLALEIVSLLLGGSLMGLGGDADVDLDADFDVDADIGLDTDVDLDAPDIDAEADVAPAGNASFLTWLGLGGVPFILWFAALLAGFGLTGLIMQSVSNAVTGVLVPRLIALPVGLIGGVAFARTFGGVFSRLIPRDESAAVAISRLGGRRGVVSQGIARRGHAAEVRVTDAHGNVHYLRAEPMEDDAQIAQGSDVLVIRQRIAPGEYRFRLMSISEV